MTTESLDQTTVPKTVDKHITQTETKPTVTLCELKFEQWLNVQKIRATEDRWLTWQAAWSAKP